MAHHVPSYQQSPKAWYPPLGRWLTWIPSIFCAIPFCLCNASGRASSKGKLVPSNWFLVLRELRARMTILIGKLTLWICLLKQTIALLLNNTCFFVNSNITPKAANSSIIGECYRRRTIHYTHRRMWRLQLPARPCTHGGISRSTIQVAAMLLSFRGRQ